MLIGYATQDRSVTALDQLGGAGWYRCGMPGVELAKHGHDVRLGLAVGIRGGPIGIIPAEDSQLDTQRERIARLWVPDVIVLQRLMGDGLAEEIAAAKLAGQLVVNDVDDLLWNAPVTNSAWRATHPAVHPDNNINHYKKVLAASSMITVSTPYLAEAVSRFCRDMPIVVVRNAIDLERWAVHQHEKPPRLGWTGVLTHRANDIEVVSRGLSRFLGDGYAKQFTHVGSLNYEGAPHLHEIAGLEAEQVLEFGMVPIDEWPNQLRHIDVGVVPLSDHTFNRAKSCIKGMEYAAAGIPFVATDSPEYVWLYTQLGIGRLAPRGKHWVAHLHELLDPSARLIEAAQQRRALQALDISTRWKEWEDAYAAAVS